MTAHVDVSSPVGVPGFQSNRAADRAMRRLFGITSPTQRGSARAHRAFRLSVAASGVRCLITYLLLPILVPMLSLAGWVAAPIGMALCVLAVINGVISVRRFWRADHSRRWMYTAFIGVVFVILAIALISDVQRLGVIT